LNDPDRFVIVKPELFLHGTTLTALYLNFEKEVEAALGLPPGVHSYALLPIGYPMGRFGPVRRVPLADVVYEDRWGEPYGDL
jgi:nitroreductase